MSHIGRNDPCPCGSGRKYKHCCLAARDDLEARWRQLRGAEGRIIPELCRVALDTWGEEGFHEAHRRFYAGVEAPADPPSGREFESLFLTWFALRFAPRPARGGEPMPAARRWLDDPAHALDPDRRVVAELARRPVSFHHVVAVDPGVSIDLEDLLTGAACSVIERSASQVVRRGGVLFGRTLTLDGVSILVGCGAAAIPPTFRIDVQRLRDTLAAEGRRLTTEAVLDLDDELRHAYLTIADRVFNPKPPQLRNTDGDPFAPTTLQFELRCTVAEAFAALRSLSATAGDDAEATFGADGRLATFTITWAKRGNKLHASWDNTILGRIDGSRDGLKVSVNSRRRATRLRKEIEKRLGPRAMFVRAVEESIDALLADARRTGESPEPEPPELAALTAEWLERNWTEWLDTPVPALADQTPRQAARTPAGRERLSALLDEFEWHADSSQPPPVARLRAELGLEA